MIHIVLAAGGTGGHLFPATTLCDELKQRGYNVTIATDTRGLNYLTDYTNANIVTMRAASPAKPTWQQRAHAIRQLILGTYDAYRFLKRIRPRVVVGFGGYVTAPALCAAWWLRIPFIIHEQNALLGRVNRPAAHFAARLALSFQNTARLNACYRNKTVITGNPVRPAFLAARQFPYPVIHDNGPITLLVTGGSQGAAFFNTLLPDACALLPAPLRQRLEIIQQCRADDIDTTRATYQAAGINATLSPFFSDIPQRMAMCHLVIGRAGASSVTEPAMVGRPAVLIPLPSAADDHQTYNARAFIANGAGWLVPQQAATPAYLARLLHDILSNPDTLKNAAEKARLQATPHAAQKLADMVAEFGWPL